MSDSAGSSGSNRKGTGTDMPKYPEVTVNLSGADGNIFAIGGRVRHALRKAKVPREEIDLFCRELRATKSYDEALQKVMEWVDWT